MSVKNNECVFIGSVSADIRFHPEIVRGDAIVDGCKYIALVIEQI